MISTDVRSFLSDDAKQAWSAGKWAGKITVHDLVKHLQSLGRLATTQDIDAYVASMKSEDLDKPMTAAEIRERFQGKKRLDDMPVTRMALRWLRDQKVNGRAGSDDFGVWKAMKTRAGKEGQQLCLALVQALFATVTKVLAVEAYGPDTTVIEYAVGGTFACSFDGCAGQTVPQMRTLTDPNGRARKHEAGPLAGKDLRVGDFLIAPRQSGYEVNCLCREHRKLAIQAGNTTYPYEDAAAIADVLNAEAETEKEKELKRQRDLEAMKKLAADSPNFATRQKYADVRNTRDNNRNRRR